MGIRFTRDNAGIGFLLAAALLTLAAGYGWVENIIKIAHMADGSITGMFVLRVIGIFVGPLGAILGYL